MSKHQEMDWGSIDWLYEPEEGSSDNMRVGISVMNPGCTQPRHIHYGDEQLMYVLSGHGKQRIGNEELPVEAGQIYHISTGMAHESVNESDEPIRKLLVSIPAVTSAPKVRMNEAPRVKKQETIEPPVFLRETVRELYRSTLSSLNMPIAIFDSDYQLVFKGGNFPAFCNKQCGIEGDLFSCPLIRNKPTWGPPLYEGASGYVCAYGMWVYTLPIVAGGELLGFIQGGFVRTDKGCAPSDPDLPYQVPESTVGGIVQVLHRISESICNHYQTCSMQVALQRNIRKLSDQQKIDSLLQETLKTSQNQTFNLQINQHFLFNTLNTIAGMAIKEEAFQTYQTIGDLAQLLRYTLRTTDLTVPLSAELDYVRNYTNLQKARFGNRLTVDYQIDAALLQQNVAFNFLQPIVENCFNHAFSSKRGDMRVRIAAKCSAAKLEITVADNGSGMDEGTLTLLRSRIAEGDGKHGTTMVAQKLRAMYGCDAEYLVDSDENGTTVTVRLPMGKETA